MIELISIVDCETSGLRKPHAPPDDPTQPRMVQLSCKTVRGSDRACVHRFTRIIRPDGWSIEADAERIHGISERAAYQCGIALPIVLAELRASVSISTKIIGFNLLGFDAGVIDLALRDAQADGTWWRRRRQDMIDLMEVCQPILALPGLYNDYKLPSLEEAMNALVYHTTENDVPWASTHNAEADVEATEALYWALRDRGMS